MGLRIFDSALDGFERKIHAIVDYYNLNVIEKDGFDSTHT